MGSAEPRGSVVMVSRAFFGAVVCSSPFVSPLSKILLGSPVLYLFGLYRYRDTIGCCNDVEMMTTTGENLKT